MDTQREGNEQHVSIALWSCSSFHCNPDPINFSTVSKSTSVGDLTLWRLSVLRSSFLAEAKTKSFIFHPDPPCWHPSPRLERMTANYSLHIFICGNQKRSCVSKARITTHEDTGNNRHADISMEASENLFLISSVFSPHLSPVFSFPC